MFALGIDLFLKAWPEASLHISAFNYGINRCVPFSPVEYFDTVEAFMAAIKATPIPHPPPDEPGPAQAPGFEARLASLEARVQALESQQVPFAATAAPAAAE